MSDESAASDRIDSEEIDDDDDDAIEAERELRGEY